MVETLLLPISLFGGSLFAFLPGYFSTLPACFLVVYLIYLLKKNWSKINCRFQSGVILFILFLVVVQGIATIRTIIKFPLTGIGVFDQYFQFITLLVYFIVTFFVLKITLHDDQKVRQFLRGFLIYSLILMSIILLQLIYLQTGWLRLVVEFIGHYFSTGSYSESINPDYLLSTINYLNKFSHPNGLDPEGRDVAIRLAVLVVPFCLASYKDNYQLFKNKLVNKIIFPLLLLITIFLLLAIKTVASVIFAVLAIMMTLIVLISKLSQINQINRKKNSLTSKLGVAIAIVISIGLIVMLFIPQVFNLTGDSNRRASMLAHWHVFLAHPLIGVGYDFSSPYAIIMTPLSYTDSLVNIHTYLAHNKMPALSVAIAWLSQFGLLIVLPVAFYLLKAKLDFTILVDRMIEATLDQSKINLYQTIDDLFFLMIIFLIPAVILLFDWRSLSYLLVLFFMLVAKDLLREQLKVLAPLEEKAER